jgi:hypothetical protein
MYLYNMEHHFICYHESVQTVRDAAKKVGEGLRYWASDAQESGR